MHSMKTNVVLFLCSWGNRKTYLLYKKSIMTFSGRELGPAAPQHRSAGPLTQLMVPDGGRIHVMASK